MEPSGFERGHKKEADPHRPGVGLSPTLPTKSERLKMAMMRMGSHSPSVQLWISDSSPGKRHSVMK